MYVGVIFYRFKPDTINDAVRDWEEMVVNEAKKQNGYKTTFCVIEHHPGWILIVTFLTKAR